MKRRVVLATITLAAVAIGTLASVLATPYGLGVTPDSLVYLHAADSLRHGQGLRVPAYDGSLMPLTHYPPLFPVSLALAASVGSDLLTAARVVSLAVTAANIVVVAVATYAFTRSVGAMSASVFLMSLSVEMLFVNTAVWSDGQFIVAEVVSLILITAYLQGRGYPYLVLGALAAALAWLVRWIGGAVVVAGALGILFLGARRAQKRLADAVLFGVLASAPTLAWMVHNIAVAETATNRSFGVSTLSMDHLTALGQTMSSWLLPGTNRVQLFAWQDQIVMICAAAAIVALIALTRRFVLPAIIDRSALMDTPVLFLLFAFVYVVAALAATSLFDSSVPLDNRILAPAYVAVVVVVTFILHAAFRRADLHAWRVAGGVALSAFLLVNAVVSVGAGAIFRKEGRGFVGPAWQYPALQRALAEFEEPTRLYSNHPGGVEFALGRKAMGVSHEALAAAVAGQGIAILVYFDDPRSFAPRNAQAAKMAPSTAEQRTELLRGLSATLVARERNGWVYRLEPARAELQR